MGKIESMIKLEILRLGKREVRKVFLPLRREVRGMRLKLSSLSKNFAVLDRLTKEKMRQEESEKLSLAASPEEVKASRFTPQRISKLRKKLGLSQRALALLTGVSVGAVGLWEKGKFHPAANKKAALVALRKLRKRDVKRILSQKTAETGRKKPEEGKREVKKARARKPPKKKAKAPASKKARRKA